MKSRSFAITLFLLLFSLVLVCSLSATGKGEAAQAGPGAAETFSLYVGDFWQTNYIDPSWTDPVAKEITKRTGVTLNVSVVKAEDDDGEMNKQIAAGDLTDLIFKTYGSSKEALVKGKYVKPLDALIDKYGPNIKKYHSGTFSAWRNRSDNNIYCLGFWYFNKVSKYGLNLQVSTLQMRYDILKELGYEKLVRDKEGNRNSFITMDEYMGLLDKVKAKYPDMTPVMVEPKTALDILLKSRGIQLWWDGLWEDGKFVRRDHSKLTEQVLTDINSLYQKGYAAIGDTTADDESRKARMADGKVFSCLGYANLISDVQATLAKENDEKRYVMFYLTKDPSVKYVYMNGAWTDSAAGIHINAKMDDARTARAMKFLDYCMSPEGSLLVCSGVEGISYSKDPTTGWYKPTDEVFAGYRTWDANVLRKTGVGGWTNILPNIAGVDEKGNAWDINAQYGFSQDKWVIYNNSDWKYFAFNWPITPYSELDSDTQAAALDASSKISAYAPDRIVNIALSKNVDTLQSEYSKFVAQMKTDGLDAFETAWTDNWKAYAKSKGRAPEHFFMVVDEVK